MEKIVAQEMDHKERVEEAEIHKTAAGETVESTEGKEGSSGNRLDSEAGKDNPTELEIMTGWRKEPGLKGQAENFRGGHVGVTQGA